MPTLDIDDSYDTFIDGKLVEAKEKLVKDLKTFSEYDDYPVFEKIVDEITNTIPRSLEEIFKEIEEICINNCIDCPALGVESQDDNPEDD